MAKADNIDIEITDDHDLENVAVDVYNHLQLMADDIQQGLIDEARETFKEAQEGMDAIEAYLKQR